MSMYQATTVWAMSNTSEAYRREADARMGRLAAGFSRRRRWFLQRPEAVRPRPAHGAHAVMTSPAGPAVA